MNINKQAFSIIEIIITITIITLLATIGISSKQGYDNNNSNAKILSDIQSINNALESYIIDNNNLPIPNGNTNFYKKDTTYSHGYENIDTFGVYGSITEKTIPNKYLNNTPIDTRTNSYYSYGKTKNTNNFEIAAINIIDNTPVSKVVGNYTAENGPYNLIREYNGPNFVNNNSDINLPYNPYELKLIGKIDNIVGDVEIKTKIGKNITDLNEIINYNLETGDTINVSIGSSAQIYFSDGSTSIIGDKTQSSSVTITEIMFKGKDNLTTFIKLYLSVGSIWTKATKLDQNSNFQIDTKDSSAAVRGTIFGVLKNNINTQIILIEGSLDISKNGTFIKNIKVENGEQFKKIEMDEINTIQSLITENSLPEFSKGNDIRSDETINNIIIDNTETGINPADNTETGINPADNVNYHDNDNEEEKKSIIKNGIGCEQCPNGIIVSGTNRAGLKCGTFGGKRDEKYCKGVKGYDGLDVICATEKSISISKCSGRTLKNWIGNYTH